MTARSAARRALSTWTAILAAWALALSAIVTAPPAAAGFAGTLCSGEPVPGPDPVPAADHDGHDCCLPKPAGTAGLPPPAVVEPVPPSAGSGGAPVRRADEAPPARPWRHPQAPRAPPAAATA